MAKREPYWVNLFLRELERTGNVRIAAQAAGVDFTSAYQRRKRHAEFADRWEGAVSAYKQSVCASRTAPGSAAMLNPSTIGASANGPPPQDKLGEELTAHPNGKLIRAGPGRWSRRAEAAFLAALAETANVRRAAEAAGVSTTAVYARRLKRAEFAEAWEMALDTGKARLEAMLVEAAQRRFDPDTLPISDGEPQSFGGHPPDGRVLPISVGEAIHIVKLKRTEPGRGPGHGSIGGGGREPRVATPEEAEKELIRRLKVFAARVQKEDIANGWSVHEGRSIPPGWVRAEDARCVKCGAEPGLAPRADQRAACQENADD